MLNAKDHSLVKKANRIGVYSHSPKRHFGNDGTLITQVTIFCFGHRVGVAEEAEGEEDWEHSVPRGDWECHPPAHKRTLAEINTTRLQWEII